MKIAIVGSGISGLVCAYYLSRQHDVEVFEAGSYIGGHTNTVEVSTASGRYSIDTGFIVFNDWTYPNFIRLLDKLGVASQPSNMSFSVRVEESGLEYNGADMNRLFVQRLNFFRPSFHLMIRDILRFNKEALTLLDKPEDHMSLGRYLQEKRYSRGFIDNYIIPMGAAIWSAPVEKMREFPVRTFVQFFKNHGMLSVDKRPQWRTVAGGSKNYVAAMTRSFQDKIHLNTPVQSVRRSGEQVFVKTAGPAGEKEDAFDHVVMAAHSDQTLRLLANATDKEKEILRHFAYQPNDALLHTDASVLPRKRAAWASWNYLVPSASQQRVAVTYDMNILQDLKAPETFCVSLNMDDKVDPKKVLKKIHYHHPVFTPAAVIAQKRWGEISGAARIHFCGAYWGFGFHEDGVNSGLRVCESLGVK